ncbi:3-hydroxyisobutyrate dehydrogenase [Verticiella sediminum]|uniref:3-hydroxyisobutyrate dehydrogenase n=1 Tax=Verticiella sediminum TaxID=1247510 RepID=A0A556ADW9_9BURK|nr:3-hydroxyisobutyrate dehydrogenase [Verticiella sediminum]TSH91063.1 3-hydroxyisobutyrate dehydrogenase [Verticiella sediminum]
MTIAFIGLGNMGAPMARNLLKAGRKLVVYDLSTDAVADLVSAGAQAAESVGHAASLAQTAVITMLPAGTHVRTVYLGEDGVLARATRGVPLIDSSTIDPATAREVSAAAQGQGNPMADAPVSGGTGGAQAGTLTFMVGAEAGLFDTIRPILAEMGRNIAHCGGAGNGQVAKLCNNMLLGISMIGVSEAMALGVSLGMDPKALAEVINTSSGRCWSSDTYNPWPGVMDNVPAARGYTGGFGTPLMLKDLGLATEAARQAGQPVHLGALAQQLYQWFAANGHAAEDFSAIVKLYEQG